MEGQNLILVTIDSLRADKTSATKGASYTPNLDRIAESGVLYENATAPGPSTYESMPSIWTGELMPEINVKGTTALDRMAKRKESHMNSYTFPERLRDLGYETAAFTANPHTSRHSNFDRGFQDFEDYLGDGIHPFWEWAGKKPILSKIKHLVTTISRDRVARPWTSYTDDIKGWLETASSPFFLWIFILEPHTPYLPRPQNRRTSWGKMIWNNIRYWSDPDGVFPPDPQELMGLYEDAVIDADEFIGWLYQHMPEETSVIVHSDHGEGFGKLDHGQWGHKGELYDENIHVPLVVNDFNTTGKISEPVSLTSIFDILIDLARGEYRPKDYGQEYTISRTFRPNKIGIRSEELSFCATLSGGNITDEKLLECDGNREKEVENEDIYEKMHDLLRYRQSHEQELRLLRSSCSTVSNNLEI